MLEAAVVRTVPIHVILEYSSSLVSNRSAGGDCALRSSVHPSINADAVHTSRGKRTPTHLHDAPNVMVMFQKSPFQACPNEGSPRC